MRRKLLLASLFTASSFIFLHSYVYTSSSGAPAGNTGAPGETTCQQSGCHSGNALNDAGGSFDIKVMDGGNEVTEFINGKTYDVTVSLTRSAASAFGFQATVKGSNTAGGTLSTGGNTDVKKLSNYITHTNPTPHHSGMDEWTFKWTAPDAGAGNINIYASGNAANGNQTTIGDFIYTAQKTLTPSATSISENTLFSQNMRMYPNPVQNVLAVDYTFPEKANSKAVLMIYSADGKLMKTIEQQAKAFFSNTIYADLSGFNKGIYLVKLSINNNTSVKRIMKQ